MIAVSLEMVAVSVGADLRDGAAGAIVTGVSTDSRTLNRGDLFVPIRGPRFDGHAFVAQAVQRGAAGVLVDQRYDCEAAARRSVAYMVVDDTTAALGRLAAAFRRDVMPASTTVVAVTGSNGKTTTKRMIDHVLRASIRGRCSPRSFNNAIGVPLTLLSAEQSDRYLVVEIGSNAPGEVAALAAIAAPDVGVITSVGEAHLERFHDLHGVVVEKTSLLEHVAPTGLCVVNGDDAVLDKLEAYGGMNIDGHCPMVRGKWLNAYIAAGIQNCHETVTPEEGREKLQKGMALIIREGSVAKNLRTLAGLVTEFNSPQCFLCTDDRNPFEIFNKNRLV
ncbi:MAG: hypothetical protein IIB61_01930 [Planctomycetes bacterium]|nr:hypothetical protein [Planctomycetota bacterium]